MAKKRIGLYLIRFQKMLFYEKGKKNYKKGSGTVFTKDENFNTLKFNSGSRAHFPKARYDYDEGVGSTDVFIAGKILNKC